jgi:hypothetical protein
VSLSSEHPAPSRYIRASVVRPRSVADAWVGKGLLKPAKNPRKTRGRGRPPLSTTVRKPMRIGPLTSTFGRCRTTLVIVGEMQKSVPEGPAKPCTAVRFRSPPPTDTQLGAYI